jgi:hypothetical protein
MGAVTIEKLYIRRHPIAEIHFMSSRGAVQFSEGLIRNWAGLPPHATRAERYRVADWESTNVLEFPWDLSGCRMLMYCNPH